MKELDVLLERYLARDYPQAEPSEQAQFERLLEMEDPDLCDRCMGRVVAEPEFAPLIAKIRAPH